MRPKVLHRITIGSAVSSATQANSEVLVLEELGEITVYFTTLYTQPRAAHR